LVTLQLIPAGFGFIVTRFQIVIAGRCSVVDAWQIAFGDALLRAVAV